MWYILILVIIHQGTSFIAFVLLFHTFWSLSWQLAASILFTGFFFTPGRWQNFDIKIIFNGCWTNHVRIFIVHHKTLHIFWYEVQITNFSTVKALIRGHKKATAKSHWSLKAIWIWKRNTQQRMKYCHMQLGFNVTKCLIRNTIINYCTNRKTKKRKPGVETWFISRVMNNWCCDSMNKFFQALTSFISSKHFSKNLCERLFFWL